MKVRHTAVLLSLLLGGAGTSFVVAQSPSNRNLAAPMQAGEMRLDGEVLEFKNENTFLLRAISFTSPNGRTKTFDQPKVKEILLDENVLVQERETGKYLELSAIKPGASIGAMGRDNGKGTALVCRVVWVDVPK